MGSNGRWLYFMCVLFHILVVNVCVINTFVWYGDHKHLFETLEKQNHVSQTMPLETSKTSPYPFTFWRRRRTVLPSFQSRLLSGFKPKLRKALLKDGKLQQLQEIEKLLKKKIQVRSRNSLSSDDSNKYSTKIGVPYYKKHSLDAHRLNGIILPSLTETSRTKFLEKSINRFDSDYTNQPENVNIPLPHSFEYSPNLFKLSKVPHRENNMDNLGGTIGPVSFIQNREQVYKEDPREQIYKEDPREQIYKEDHLQNYDNDLKSMYDYVNSVQKPLIVKDKSDKFADGFRSLSSSSPSRPLAAGRFGDLTHETMPQGDAADSTLGSFFVNQGPKTTSGFSDSDFGSFGSNDGDVRFLGGSFDDDASGCEGIERRRCSTDLDCMCYGIYHCSNSDNVCALYPNPSSDVSASEPIGTWHDL